MHAQNSAKDSQGSGNQSGQTSQTTTANPNTKEEDFLITDQAAPQQQAQTQFGGVTIWDFVRMILILAGVVGAIYGLFYLLKKSAGPKTQSNDLIRVLDYKVLNGNKGVHLVELGNHIYLVGSSDSSVSMLAEITDKETQDKIHLEISQRPNQTPPKFAQVLGKLLGAKDTPTLAVNDTFSFMKKQKDRLKKLQ